jgi:O-antigen ligase
VIVVLGALLFLLIYRDLMLGIILFLIFNLIVPQAGPSLSLGIKTPVGERGIHFCPHEIFITMVLVAWLIQIFLKKADWREKNPLLWVLILYIVINIISCFVGVTNGGRLLIIAFRFMRTTFLAYIFFVVINNVKTRKQIKQLVIISLICATIVAGFGVVQWAMGQTWSENFSKKVLDRIGYPQNVNFVAGESEGQAYRVNSTFAHPNVLGGYLVFFLPFFVSLLWGTKNFFARLFLAGGLLINLVCLFFTGSRMSWIAAAAIALAYGVLGLLDRRLVISFVVLVLIVVAVFVLIYPPPFIKMRLTGTQAQKSVQGRLYYYQLAADEFMKRPFFGLGEGMVGYIIKQGNIRQMWGGVENVYLTFLVAEGIVGLTAFLLIWLVFWGMMFAAKKRSRPDPFISYTCEALILGMLGYATASVFGSWLLFATAMMTIWWFYLGLGGTIYNFAKREFPEPAAPAWRAARFSWNTS